jgi:SAM-dependent methyltransferase
MNDELAQAWDHAADGYERYFVPRFAPWVTTAITGLQGGLPHGPILVPCCGTFPELPPLADEHPNREIVGIDLSQGMLDQAQQRTAAHPNARLLHHDATHLTSLWPGTAAAVVSVFGLQQLPDPLTAITDWLAALRPGGRLSVVCWPPKTETEGPFALLDTVVRPTTEYPSWPDRLADHLTTAGAKVDRDEPVSHQIDHPDAETFWTAMTSGGPLRRFVQSRSEEFTSSLHADFLNQAPSGPWTHHPTARWLVAHARSTD